MHSKTEGKLPDQEEKMMTSEVDSWSKTPDQACVPVTLIIAYTSLMNQMYFTILCRVKTNPIVKCMANFLYPVLLGYIGGFLYSKTLRKFILEKRNYTSAQTTTDIITR